MFPGGCNTLESPSSLWCQIVFYTAGDYIGDAGLKENETHIHFKYLLTLCIPSKTSSMTHASQSAVITIKKFSSRTRSLRFGGFSTYTQFPWTAWHFQAERAD